MLATNRHFTTVLFVLLTSWTAGAGPPNGDLDNDNDVDLVDYTLFVDCVTGPEGGPIGATCAAVDFDLDTDVDAVDWSGFQSVFGFVGPPSGLFFGNPEFRVGFAPTGVAAGDLNGDDIPDMAVCFEGSSNDPDGVSILIGLGGGLFAEHVTYDAGSSPNSVAVDDLDGQNGPDIAVSNLFSHDVSVLLNNGDGTFTPAVSYGTGTNPRAVAIGDLDGDNDMDLAVLRAVGTMSILLNNGNGTFAPLVSYPTGSGPWNFAMGDLDGDTDLDLAVGNASLDTVSILLNNGDGTFAPLVAYPTVGNAWAVALGHFNADAILDIALATRWDDSTAILINNGDGSFATPVLYPTGLDGWGVTIGDLDGDGDDDVAVSNANNRENNVSVLLNNGDGTFADQSKYQAGRDPRAMTSADLDGDGRVDLVTANNGKSNVSVLLNNGGGVFGSDIQVAAADCCPTAVAIADLDGDSDPDLAAAHDSDDFVSVMLNDSAGAFTLDGEYATSANPMSVATGMLDGNGSIDLVTGNLDSHNISVLLNNGDGTFATHATYPTGSFPGHAAIGHFDGGNGADIVIVRRIIDNGRSYVAVLLNDGDGTFGPPTDYEVGPGSWTVVAGNFTGDANTDLAVTHFNPPFLGVSIVQGVGDGTFLSRVDYPAGDRPGGLAAGDFDGDGDLDLVVTNRSLPTGFSTITVLLNNGGAFGPGAPYDAGDNPFHAAVGDLDGDGAIDIAAVNRNGQNVSVFLNNGDGTFAEQIKFGVGANCESIAIDDLDADGDLDIAVANGDFPGSISVLKNRTIR